MKDVSSMTDAELQAAYKSGKDPFEAALRAEGVTGPVADIARSIYMQESGGGKNTKTSNAGAVGGMQIIPSTFSSVADKGWNISDPEQNARAGLRYVKKLYDQAGGDPALTAAGYYGGPGGLEKARKGVAVSDPRNPNAPTTLQYGQQVAARIPKERGIVQRGVEAMIPSANAAEPSGDLAGMSDADLMALYSKSKPKAEPTMAQSVKQGVGNVAAGLVRGAGSIGATLLAPVDMVSDALDGKGLSLESNRQRRKDMDASLQDMGAEPDSLLYQAGKLTGEIAGTAGAGTVVAAPLKAAGIAPRLTQAISTAGMRTGGAPVTTLAGRAGDLGVRAAGGAVNGAVSAGLVNPEDAATGAVVGGALPGAMVVARKGGQVIGNALSGPAVPQATRDGVIAARQAGYVIPPTQAQPTLRNRLIEGFAGKLTTAQNASVKNQPVTNRLAQEAIGATELSAVGLADVRKRANAVYTELGNVGQLQTDAAFRDALKQAGTRDAKFAADFPELVNKDIDGLLANFEGKQSFDSQSAIEAIKRLREGQRAGMNAFDDAEKKAYAKAQGHIANALEGVVERNLAKSGNTQLLESFKDARQTLAKTYDVEKALNAETGNVDARKLSAALKKGRPLTGGLKEAASFASNFKDAAKPIESMGSLPQTSPLDWFGSASIAGSMHNPLMLAGVAARPAVRSLALSPFVQNGLGAPATQNRLAALAANSRVPQLAYRAAPAISTD